MRQTVPHLGVYAKVFWPMELHTVLRLGVRFRVSYVLVTTCFDRSCALENFFSDVGSCASSSPSRFVRGVFCSVLCARLFALCICPGVSAGAET